MADTIVSFGDTLEKRAEVRMVYVYKSHIKTFVNICFIFIISEIYDFVFFYRASDAR